MWSARSYRRLRLQGCATSIIHEPRDSKAAEAIRNGNFRLMMQFKCAHAAPASGNRPGFTLLLVCLPPSTVSAIQNSVDGLNRIAVATPGDKEQRGHRVC